MEIAFWSYETEAVQQQPHDFLPSSSHSPLRSQKRNQPISIITVITWRLTLYSSLSLVFFRLRRKSSRKVLEPSPRGLKYVPHFLVDIIHTIRLPFFVIKPGYNKLYKAIYDSVSSLLDEAEKSGMKSAEACHNLVFLAGFNVFGGMKVLFPTVIKWIASGGESLHRRLAEEIRAVVKEEET
ncbi:hypothetical protein L2E82_00874 [Cichorium intybus]|uniref:Uncharacterized protein n=1 Tax=Cichorium intybus TaxID=13427 RepID=A0ACB9GXI9_CICIN|nr:hypothetical protein L2E82_00874 [Cichorium intybus]